MNRITAKADTKVLVGVLVALALFVGLVAVVKLDVFGSKGGGLGKDFKYDVKEMAYIDPNLIFYEESGRVIETGFAEARAIAVDSTGSLYVAGDTAIRIFAPSGDLLGEIKLAGTPTCLTVVEDGTVYVGLQDHVEVYDPRGQRQASWDDLGQDAILTSIAVLRGNVLVADAGNRVVVRYDLSGKVLNYIGEKDPERNVPGFVIPSPYFDLAVPRDGLLRVVNTGRRRIESYTLDGDFEFWWGESSAAVEGFCGCCNPVNIAVLPKGGFVTCEKGLVRVKVYDSEGGFVGVVAGPAQLGVETDEGVCELPSACQSGGFDVAVDAEGRVFVLDTIRNLIRTFTEVKGRQ